MKVLKQLLAVIFAATTLASFAACGKSKPDVAETSAPVTDENQVQTEVLEATDEDFELLANLVRGVWLSSPAMRYGEDDYLIEDLLVYYDCMSENAFADAIYMLRNNGVCMYPGILPDYMTPDYICYYGDATEEEIPADPLNQFEISSGRGYCKINADQIDWALVNFFNVTPDRTKTDDDFDTDYPGEFDYYYCDGYYYFACQEGGGGGHYPTVVDCVRNDDGSYTVRYSTYQEDYEFESDYEIMEANARLREVDGERMWQVSYLKTVEYIIV